MPLSDEEPGPGTGGTASPGPGVPSSGVSSQYIRAIEEVLPQFGRNIVIVSRNQIGEGGPFGVAQLGRLNKSIGAYEAQVMHDLLLGTYLEARGPDFGMGYEMLEDDYVVQGSFYQPLDAPDAPSAPKPKKPSGDPYAGKGPQ